jgi:hypothetical protein
MFELTFEFDSLEIRFADFWRYRFFEKKEGFAGDVFTTEYVTTNTPAF